MRISTIAAMLLACALVGCQGSENGELPGENEPPAPAAVRMAEVRRGDVREVLHATGETQAVSTLRLASPVAGRVTFLSAHPGDRLAAGEIAARVLPLESAAAVDGLRLLGRTEALGAAERAESRRLERQLDRRQVVLAARFAGVVSERFHNPGEQVAAGEAVLELFDPRSLVVVAQVPIDVVPRLRTGMSVRLRAAAGATPGRVDAVLPSVAPGALTAPVRVVPSSPLDPPLRNAAVDCEILLAVHRGVPVIPASAIVARPAPGQVRVVIAVDGHARLRTIEAGVRDGDRLEVRGGLEPGERVLVAGQYGLADGAAIRVEPAAVATATPRPAAP